MLILHFKTTHRNEISPVIGGESNCILGVYRGGGGGIPNGVVGVSRKAKGGACGVGGVSCKYLGVSRVDLAASSFTLASATTSVLEANNKTPETIALRSMAVPRSSHGSTCDVTTTTTTSAANAPASALANGNDGNRVIGKPTTVHQCSTTSLGDSSTLPSITQRSKLTNSKLPTLPSATHTPSTRARFAKKPSSLNSCPSSSLRNARIANLSRACSCADMENSEIEKRRSSSLFQSSTLSRHTATANSTAASTNSPEVSSTDLDSARPESIVLVITASNSLAIPPVDKSSHDQGDDSSLDQKTFSLDNGGYQKHAASLTHATPLKHAPHMTHAPSLSDHRRRQYQRGVKRAMDRNTVRILLLITISFLTLNSPLALLEAVFYSQSITKNGGDIDAKATGGTEAAHVQAVYTLVFGICHLLANLNNACNFALYCLSGKKFRSDLASIFRSRKRL